MSFKRKDLAFGATSKRMETRHLELVNDNLEKKKIKIDNLQEETKKIKDDAMSIIAHKMEWKWIFIST